MREELIAEYYLVLHDALGPQHWWPARSRFEVIVGAYLTQNTAWTNVQLAMSALRRGHVLSVSGIRNIPLSQLETLVRPSGYFRQKAARLKTFVAFLDERYQGSLTGMFARPTDKLRQELLELNGVGPETADAILLYAGKHTVFVVDAYTRRILERHQIILPSASYEEIRALFETGLESLVEKSPSHPPSDTRMGLDKVSVHAPSAMSRAAREPLAMIYNETHGLIVHVGKHFCLKAKPVCERCPLQIFLPKPLP